MKTRVLSYPDNGSDTAHRALQRRLTAWVEEHENKVHTAALTVRDRGLLFLVLTDRPAHDAQLEDDLTDLDIEIAQAEEFNLIRLDVLALPNASPDAIRAFVDPDNTLIYYKKAEDIEYESKCSTTV